MIAVDTNILVYAHRGDSPWHAKALDAVRELAEGSAAWGLLWPCVHEFLAVVTHPRIYQPPTTLERALAQVDAWLESPTVVALGEAEGYWTALREAVLAGQVVGPKVHDARVASLCSTHGVRQLWSADRDFSRFSSVNVVNPLVRR